MARWVEVVDMVLAKQTIRFGKYDGGPDKHLFSKEMDMHNQKLIVDY